MYLTAIDVRARGRLARSRPYEVTRAYLGRTRDQKLQQAVADGISQRSVLCVLRWYVLAHESRDSCRFSHEARVAEARVDRVDNDVRAGEVCEGECVEDVDSLRFGVPLFGHKERFLLETLQDILAALLHTGQDTVDPVVHLGRDDRQVGFQVGGGCGRGKTRGLLEFGKKQDGEERVGDVVDLRAADHSFSGSGK